MKKLSRIGCICLLLIFSRCAQVGSLTGGQPDRTAPALVAVTPPMSSTSFTSQLIVLEFDEYIQLVDQANEVLISPRLPELPEMTVKGKKLLIRFKKEHLQPNTTYRVAFGNAIADMNERNQLKDFEYIFSTGVVIDSLMLKGNITQAEDNTSAFDMVACLYNFKEGYDSLPYKELPIYICKADRSGDFQFKHLPKGNYQLMVIGDKNRNLLYDGEKERIGFISKALALKADTSVSIKAFKEPPSKTFILKTVSQEYGKALILLNKSSNWKLSALKSSQTKDVLLPRETDTKDTLTVLYKNIQDTLALISQAPDGVRDTLFIRVPFFRNNPQMSPVVQIPAYPPTTADKAVFVFNRWMDTSATKLSALNLLSQSDTLVKKIAVKARWLSANSFQVENALLPGTTYTLMADTSVFKDMMGIRNAAFNVIYKTKTPLDFGKLILKIKFNIKQQYVIEVMNERQQLVAKRIVELALSGSNAAVIEFSMLPPGTYQVRIVYDDNKNDKWDTGSLLKRKQAEKISILPKQVKVIPDWELEEEIIEK